MWEKVGLLREEEGLASAVAEIGQRSLDVADERSEAANLITAAGLIAQAALARRESRGSHFRLDYPTLDPRWRRHQVLIAPTAAALAR
jgi:L-aspartate oxidase